MGIDKNINKDKGIEIEEGFMDDAEFKKKYKTPFKQRHSEEYLNEVSEEERDLFTDAEILTARNCHGHFNRFNNTGVNKGKRYSTVKKRFINSFLREIDAKIEKDGEHKFWKPFFDEMESGNFKFLETMLNRTMGKPVEKIEVKQEGEITFSLEPDKNALDRQKKHLNKE